MERKEEIRLVTQVAVFHNRHAFDKLMKEYQSPIRRFLLSQTFGDSQLSDDLAQDTFLRAYSRISQFQGRSSFLTWLFRIAYNVLYDYMRSRKETIDIDTPYLKGEGTAATDSNLKMDLYRALQLLNDNERVCITLQLMEGQSIEKIADICSIPQNTVKSHLARGKKKMADFLRLNGYK